MTEAIFKERLQAIIDWADIAMKNPQEFDSRGVRNLDGPVFDAAREALAKDSPVSNSDGYRDGFAAAIKQAAAVVDAGAADFERQATAAPYGQAHDALLMASDALELTADAVRCLVASAEGDAE